MSTVTLTKQCKCKSATASGPRITTRLITIEEGLKTSTILRATMVRMACDECDTPWQIEAYTTPIGAL